MHEYTHTHTHTCTAHTHTAGMLDAGTVQSIDSWMTLCGPPAVCKGVEVSGQTTVAVHEANKRAKSELTVYIKNSTTLSMVNESFTDFLDQLRTKSR